VAGTGRTHDVAVPLVRLLARAGRTAPPAFREGPSLVSLPAHPRQGEAVVVVEAHHDDAALSVGGLMLRTRARLTLLTVFSDSDSLHPQVAGCAREAGLVPSELRARESQAAAAALGAEWEGLGRRDGEAEAADPDGRAALARAVADAVAWYVPEGALVLLPAAVGGSPSHQAVASAAARFPRHLLYEDVAPVPAYAGLTGAFWEWYDRLLERYEPRYVDVGAVLEDKVRLASLYRSQFSHRQACTLTSHARAVGRSMAHLGATPVAFAERLYAPRGALPEPCLGEGWPWS
jgi:LmbE family N-acetylglucosaminyl deacetylase